ncbi:MAG: peptidoglycan-associated lipoprotein Pal [Betaproteobacteria bacterium]|jgi:peptidoglycan-associated lipoprotein|nr:peptidoglycan-associated lipoprotein Pal [Betaproteobacteria bacterium]NBT11316.1 peptidoglycan-associated lipoprotein Pal [Betaproteobacteria bacterium]NBU50518.1 peptidoglycan-associated lipoprotein Pal [Betaproteobacteria bacterium]NBX95426.1 peptidoglycan-associated lipoprotein Pal [Betaproteobacteria bacterium]
MRAHSVSLARSGLLAVATALLLGACASSVNLDEGNKVPVEDRQAGGASGGAAAGGAQSGVSTVNLNNRTGTADSLLRVVYFDFDSFAVRDDARPVIDTHAKRLAANAGLKMTVEGHTDERGSREYNLALGQKRAEAVVKSLTLLGARAAQVEPVSFGMERPAVQGSDEAAYAKNRRAELKDR